MRLGLISYIFAGFVTLTILNSADGFFYSDNGLKLDEDASTKLTADTESSVEKRNSPLQPCASSDTRTSIQSSALTRFGGRSRSGWQLYLLRRRRPWLLLPNRSCYRQPCHSSKDCCRIDNICDKAAKVCYECWYGFPCKTSADCCQKYPICENNDTANEWGRCGS
ncbi:uncharacterized protein LOC141908837 isoform X1 [Tubulanus polymorphus]|uniref:uncharacterized protein LOC141908837 isoform X1 n=1 Tax=Tubulanus polymorphus TaxID=672921 RepID=UPI003DA593E1